jgi:hypothetical protein
VSIRLLLLLPAMLSLSAGGALRAQQPAFSGVIRGVLIACDDPGPAGEFCLRARSTNQVYRFRFDAKTYVEREEQRVSMSGLQKGDTIEVVADRDESVAVHYARTVHVIEAPHRPRPAALSSRSRAYRPNFMDFLAPRGNLTYAGVIARLTADRLVLHTRQEGEKTILLRLDTRFLEGGTMVEAADLKPNTRVFVRAGKNLDDQIEAYHVIWGEILKPTQPR